MKYSVIVRKLISCNPAKYKLMKIETAIKYYEVYVCCWIDAYLTPQKYDEKTGTTYTAPAQQTTERPKTFNEWLKTELE